MSAGGDPLPKDFVAKISEALEARAECQFLSAEGLGQDLPGGLSQAGGGEQATINRQPARRVQGGPGNGALQIDERSGQFKIERRVIRPGLRRLPPRPTARWRLGIQVDNAPKGLRIDEVARNSPAYRLSFRPSC